MVRFKVAPFVNYRTNRLGIKVIGKKFKFLPTLATISTKPANDTRELGGYVTSSLAEAICNQLGCGAVRVEVTNSSPETAEFRLCMGKDKGDGYVAWKISQMAIAVANWLEKHGKEVDLTTPPIITR